MQGIRFEESVAGSRRDARTRTEARPQFESVTRRENTSAGPGVRLPVAEIARSSRPGSGSPPRSRPRRTRRASVRSRGVARRCALASVALEDRALLPRIIITCHGLSARGSQRAFSLCWHGLEHQNQRRHSSRMALAAGTRLGFYEIQSALGTGGMGSASGSRHPRTRRAAAAGSPARGLCALGCPSGGGAPRALKRRRRLAPCR